MTRRITNIGASVRARLSNLARAQGADFQRILQRYVIERLLARLSASRYRDQFVLKGAMLFVVWGAGASRPTRDLDLLGFGPSMPETVRERFLEIITSQDDDGVVFDPGTLEVEPIRLANAYGGVRARMDAHLEQARVRIQVDVAFGESVKAEEVVFPPLLGGAGPRVRAYPREAVLAEKFHAAVVLGPTNSRLKDFYDLCALPQLFSIEEVSLARALLETFDRRRTALPASVTAVLLPGFFADADRGARWRALLGRDRLTLAPSEFTEVGEAIRRTFSGPLALAQRMSEGVVGEEAAR